MDFLNAKSSTQIKTSARVLRRSSRGLGRSLSRQRSRSVSSIRCDNTLITLTTINFLIKQVMSEGFYFWTQLNKIQATNQLPDHQACQLIYSHDQLINSQITNQPYLLREACLRSELGLGLGDRIRAWASKTFTRARKARRKETIIW